MIEKHSRVESSIYRAKEAIRKANDFHEEELLDDFQCDIEEQ